MISEKKHPELARALNHMTTVVGSEHTEIQWKKALCRVLYALADEVTNPLVEVQSYVPNKEKEIEKIMGRLREKHGPQREFTDLRGPTDGVGKIGCLHHVPAGGHFEGKIMGISCPCPRCSPRSVVSTSSVPAGYIPSGGRGI